MTRDSKGITQFYLLPTHEPYLLLLPSRTASPPFGWYLLRLPRLSWRGWLVIYWDRFSGTGDWTPDTVTHLSTNRARCRLTSLMETNALTTTLNRQPERTVGETRQQTCCSCQFWLDMSAAENSKWTLCGYECTGTAHGAGCTVAQRRKCHSGDCRRFSLFISRDFRLPTFCWETRLKI